MIEMSEIFNFKIFQLSKTLDRHHKMVKLTTLNELRKFSVGLLIGNLAWEYSEERSGFGQVGLRTAS